MSKHLHKPHPWHGITPGVNCPEEVTAFIEIVPGESVKYEIDKVSGYLKIDRPQKFSNAVPALYGFIPQTYCGRKIAEFASNNSKEKVSKGDGDPLDICVLTEKVITHGDILVDAIPIGGLRMIDKEEADDKIIAVLKQDEIYGNWKDISDCPKAIIDRIKHYFLTYKNLPGNHQPVIIDAVYGVEVAKTVILKSLEDYKNEIE